MRPPLRENTFQICVHGRFGFRTIQINTRARIWIGKKEERAYFNLRVIHHAAFLHETCRFAGKN